MSSEGAPDEEPRVAVNPDADDISEPTAYRLPGWQLDEEIANAFFNWLAQQWGNFLAHFAAHVQTFRSLKMARDHSLVTEGDHFRFAGRKSELQDFGYDFREVNSVSGLSSNVESIDAGGTYVVVADRGNDRAIVYDPDMTERTIVTNLVGTPVGLQVATNGSWFHLVYKDTANAQTVHHVFDDHTSPTDAQADAVNTATLGTAYDVIDVAVDRDDQVYLALYDQTDSVVVRADQNGTSISETLTGSEIHSVATRNVQSLQEYAYTYDTTEIATSSGKTESLSGVGAGGCVIAADIDGWVVFAEAASASDTSVYFLGTTFGATPIPLVDGVQEAPKTLVSTGRRLFLVDTNDAILAWERDNGISVNVTLSAGDIATDGARLYRTTPSTGEVDELMLKDAPTDFKHYRALDLHPYLRTTIGPLH